MQIEADVQVFVVLVLRRKNAKAGQPPAYEYVGVEGTFVDAVKRADMYTATTLDPNDFEHTNRGYSYFPFQDKKTTVMIRTETV